MNQLNKLFLSMSLKQRISLGVAALGVAVALFLAARWNKERDFKPVYSNLSQEDAAAVVAKVREGGTEFRLTDNGSTVLLPSDKVAEMRLQLAAAGVPKNGRIGFELFDKTNFGTSDFAEQINYHRALEGELERTIVSLAEVEQARVHLTFPKDSVFTENKQPAKASVLLKLKPGGKLAPQNVSAICQLVASAVEGLEASAVSVVDMRGNLLSRPKAAASPDDAQPDEERLNFKTKIERDLVGKINTTLEPLLGADKYRAAVSVDCDFTSGEQSEEVFDPTKSVMVTSQKTEDISGSNTSSGVPGTASNLPRPTSRPGAGAANVARRTESVTYQSSRMVRKTRLPQGNVKRVSVSILVDHEVRYQGSGPKAKRVVEPPSADRLKAIHDVVAASIGFSADRGDQLVVEALPFESTLNYEPPPPPAPAAPGPPANFQQLLQMLIKDKVMLGVAGGVVLMLVLMTAMLIKSAKRSKAAAKSEAALQAQIAATPVAEPKKLEDPVTRKLEAQLAENQATQARLELEALNSLKLPVAQTKRGEVLAKHIAEEAKKDPKMLAHVVRAWVTEANQK
ncbi:MAG: flagellar M-ring protein FliF [Acidobacteriaceae bacterium]|nr:flagellar M-ring protein FliF [Acidobacteriaceae bacterium]